MPLFPIQFESNHIQTTTKRVFVQHTIDLDEFLEVFIGDTDIPPTEDGDEPLEEVKEKWNALTEEQQKAVIEQWKEGHGFTIEGHDNHNEDDNYLECFDDESEECGSTHSEGDFDDLRMSVRDDLFGNQKKTWALMTSLFSTPAEREAKQVKDLEASLKALDDGFLIRAEKLKADFMKEMAKSRAEVEAKQEVIRKTLADLRMAKLTSV
jgi:hypothetical protein